MRIRDVEKAHAGVSDLLTRLQVIKSTGDAAGAQRIFDEFGTKLDPEWKANILARRERLRLPKLKAFVFPHLKPVVQNGEIVEVTPNAKVTPRCASASMPCSPRTSKRAARWQNHHRQRRRP